MLDCLRRRSGLFHLRSQWLVCRSAFRHANRGTLVVVCHLPGSSLQPQRFIHLWIFSPRCCLLRAPWWCEPRKSSAATLLTFYFAGVCEYNDVWLHWRNLADLEESAESQWCANCYYAWRSQRFGNVVCEVENSRGLGHRSKMTTTVLSLWANRAVKLHNHVHISPHIFFQLRYFHELRSVVSSCNHTATALVRGEC